MGQSVCGSNPDGGQEICLFSNTSKRATDLQPIPSADGTGAFFLGGKRLVREGDNSLPSSAEVKNEGSYTPTPAYTFMACIRTSLRLL